MKIEMLLQQYANGKRNFSFANLRGVVLTGIDLTKIVLCKADLENAKLIQVNFSQANLYKANLRGADLSQTNLSDANLRRADLTDAILTGAVLEGAIITGAIMPDGISYPLPHETSNTAQMDSTPQIDSVPQMNSAPQIDSIIEEAPLDFFPQFTHHPSQTHLPYLFLFLWGLGFSCFGILLALHHASYLTWLLLWSSSICWIISETLTWFIPILAAIALLTAIGISLWNLMVSGLVTSTLFVVLKVVLGWTLPETLKGSLWVGGITIIALTFANWLFYGADAYSGGGIVVAFNTLHLVVFFFFAIFFTSAGTVAWQQLLDIGLKRRQTAWMIGLIAAIGLLCGRIIGFLSAS
jgi:hypothetical protein